MFAAVDADGDGVATVDEMAASPHFRYDAAVDFVRFDADLDGRVTPAELATGAESWRAGMARRLAPAFDADGDGALSFREYRRGPFGNPFAEWHRTRSDADHDGRLSWTEFYAEAPPLLAGLARAFFDRWDRDGDGVLSPSEFDFHIDFAKAPAAVAFAAQDADGDGRLVLSEVFTEPRPDGSDPRRLQAYQLRLMRAEETLLSADADADGAVSRTEFLEARNRPASAAAFGPAAANAGWARPGDGPNWAMIGFVAFDAIVLLGLGTWFVRSSRKA